MGRLMRGATRRINRRKHQAHARLVSALWTPIAYRARRRIGYDRNYYCGELRAKNVEQMHYFRNMIRPDDMGAAASYLLGHYGWGDAQDRFRYCKTFQDQVAVGREMLSSAAHMPLRTLDIGCGRGELSAYLSALGLSVVPIDFAACAPAMVRDTYLRFAGLEPPRVINRSMLPAVREAAGGLGFTDVVMCESIEHIPEAEFWKAWDIIRHALRNGGRAIVCNLKDAWPIPKTSDGWDHIHEINDAVYRRLAEGGHVEYRNKSHIVIGF